MNKHIFKATRLAGLAILSGALLAAATTAGAQTKWKLASAWGGGPLQELGAKGFAANVEMLTNGGIKVQVKLRSTQPAASATVQPMNDGAATVTLDEAQGAVSPGQACVFYDGDRVLGGGWIIRDDAV